MAALQLLERSTLDTEGERTRLVKEVAAQDRRHVRAHVEDPIVTNGYILPNRSARLGVAVGKHRDQPLAIPYVRPQQPADGCLEPVLLYPPETVGEEGLLDRDRGHVLGSRIAVS